MLIYYAAVHLFVKTVFTYSKRQFEVYFCLNQSAALDRCIRRIRNVSSPYHRSVSSTTQSTLLPLLLLLLCGPSPCIQYACLETAGAPLDLPPWYVSLMSVGSRWMPSCLPVFDWQVTYIMDVAHIHRLFSFISWLIGAVVCLFAVPLAWAMDGRVMHSEL